MAELAMGIPAQPAIALPEFEERRTTAGATTGRDTKTETLSEEQLAAEKRQEEALAAQKTSIGERADQARKVATAEGEGVKAELGVQDWRDAQLEGPEVQKATEYVNWAKQHTKDESDRLAQRPSPALFADKEGWDNVRMAVGLALAGVGDAIGARAAVMAGHAPSGESTVKDIIDRDLTRQRAAIEKLKDNVAIARTGLSDAVEAKRALIADVNLRGAEMYKRAALLTKARMAALKVDQAAIDQTKEVSDLERARADEHAAYVKDHSKTVNNRWDSAKTTTEEVRRQAPAGGGEGKVPANTAALARQVIAEADKLASAEPLSEGALQKLQDNTLRSSAADAATAGGKLIAGGIASAGRAANLVPRTRYDGLNERDRATATTMDSMVQLIQHVLTGAGASVEEARTKAQTYGYVPGETPSSMKDKIARAKELASQYVSQGAPPAAQPAAAPAAPAAKPSSPSDDVARARAILADPKTPEKRKDLARKFLKEAMKASR